MFREDIYDTLECFDGFKFLTVETSKYQSETKHLFNIIRNQQRKLF